MPGQVQRAAGPQGSQPRQPSRVWILDENGKLQVVLIRAGVSDNTYTEVVRGELKEGQAVIIGGGSGPTPETSRNPQRMIMMGGPPR